MPKLNGTTYTASGVNPRLSKSGPGTLDQMGTHGWDKTVFKADTADCHSFNSKSVTFSGDVSVNAAGYCGDLYFGNQSLTINPISTSGVVFLNTVDTLTIGDEIDLDSTIRAVYIPDGVVETGRHWYKGGGGVLKDGVVTSQTATSKTYELRVFMKAKDGSTATASDTTTVTWQDADLPTFNITGSGDTYSVTMTSGSDEWSVIGYSWSAGGNAEITSGTTSSSCTVTERLSSFKGTSGNLSCDVKVKHKTSGVERTITTTEYISLSATESVPDLEITLSAYPTSLPDSGGKVTLSVGYTHTGTFTYSGGSGSSTSNVRTVSANDSESSKTIEFSVTETVIHESKYGDKVTKHYTASTTVSQAGKEVVTYEYTIDSVNVSLSGSGLSRTATAKVIGSKTKYVNGVKDSSGSFSGKDITSESSISWKGSSGCSVSGNGSTASASGSSYDTDYTVTATASWNGKSKSGSASFSEKKPYEKLVLKSVRFRCDDSNDAANRVPFGGIFEIHPEITGGSGDYSLIPDSNSYITLRKIQDVDTLEGQAPSDDGTFGHSTTLTFTVKDNVTGETVTGSQYVNFGKYVLSYFGKPTVETEGTAISTSSFANSNFWSISSTIRNTSDPKHDAGRSIVSIGILSKFGDENVNVTCLDGGMNLGADYSNATVFVGSGFGSGDRAYNGSISNGISSLSVQLNITISGS